MACALAQGWRVLVPDHGGARGSWTAPREPGYCVLDGIRAAQGFEPAGVARSAPVALCGYSGGGLASSWVAELWASYAPELNIVGAVLGAPVGDPGEIFRDLDGSLYAGLPALALAALVREYPGLQRIVHTHANASGQALLTRLEGTTMVGALFRCGLRETARYLDCPLDEILAMPEVLEMFGELRLGQAAPAMPLLVVQAIHDQFINVRHIDTLVESYQDQGARVTYLRDRLSEHALLYPLSTPLALRWIADRFAGEPNGYPGPQTTALLLSPRTVAGLCRVVWIVVKVALGRQLDGPQRRWQRHAAGPRRDLRRRRRRAAADRRFARHP
ncbi:lipase family protein [Mycobacterium talmoniae]|uniref:lipase family protein n=1 Tax=Mycobacterium talmoniae TaxID=1858794 RepID=UPI001F618B05|nr:MULTISPECIES: lipase family protein [Mycobacterium]